MIEPNAIDLRSAMERLDLLAYDSVVRQQLSTREAIALLARIHWLEEEVEAHARGDYSIDG